MTPTVIVEKIQEAHRGAEWLLGAYRSDGGAVPSETGILDLLCWSLRKQTALLKGDERSVVAVLSFRPRRRKKAPGKARRRKAKASAA